MLQPSRECPPPVYLLYCIYIFRLYMSWLQIWGWRDVLHEILVWSYCCFLKEYIYLFLYWLWQWSFELHPLWNVHSLFRNCLHFQRLYMTYDWSILFSLHPSLGESAPYRYLLFLLENFVHVCYEIVLWLKLLWLQ